MAAVTLERWVFVLRIAGAKSHLVLWADYENYEDELVHVNHRRRAI